MGNESSVYVGFALTLAFLTVPASRKGSASVRGLGSRSDRDRARSHRLSVFLADYF
jgi:hypothetical protein